MKHDRARAFVWLALSLLAALPAYALGPVDGEVGAVWWNNEYSVNENGIGASESAAAPGFLAELWVLERYGLRAGVYSSDLNDVGLDSSDYLSLDFMWRAFSPSQNNFLAVGAGWTDMDLATIGLDGSTSGPRVTLEGRVAVIPMLYFYGQGSYMPQLADTPASDPNVGEFQDLTATEFDVGISWKMLPVISLRAGYRTQTVNFTRTGFVPLPGGASAMDGDVESNGFLAGLTARF